MKLEKYQDPKNPEYEESSRAPGLFLHAKPMMNKTDFMKHFGVNLLKNGILAVYISAWNKNPNKSYIIYEESIRILESASDETNFHPETKDSSRELEVLHKHFLLITKKISKKRANFNRQNID